MRVDGFGIPTGRMHEGKTAIREGIGLQSVRPTCTKDRVTGPNSLGVAEDGLDAQATPPEFDFQN